MDIQLFVSPKNRIVLCCDGVFTRPIEAVRLDAQTGVLTFIFQPDGTEWQPNCVISSDICKMVQNEIFCIISYFKDQKITGSEYVNFTCLNAN